MSAPPGPARVDRRVAAALLWIVVLAGVLDALRLVVGEPPPQIDDAFISYRYASNWVAGEGLVWNPGERVEGITNPLWTALIAAGLLLGAPAPALGYGLGLASGLGLLVATVWLAWTWLPPRLGHVAAATAAPVACTASFVYWSTAGLETSLHAALCCLALVASARGAFTAMSVLLVLATFTRMDAVLFAGVLFAFQLAPRWRMRRAWLPGGVYAATVVAGLVARLAYYGTLLPNTYWAKVGGTPLSHGVAYLGGFLGDGAWPLLLPAAVAVWRAPRTRPAAACAALVCAYAVSVGGDAFAFSRFLLVVLAPLSALAVVGIVEAGRWRSGLGWLLAPSLPLACSLAIWDGVPPALAAALVPPWLVAGVAVWRPDHPGASRGALVAAVAAGVAAALLVAGGPGGVRALFAERPRELALEEQWRYAAFMEARQRRRARRLLAGERPDLVAAGAIGALGYYTDLPVLDILGLTDPHIARAAVEPAAGGLALPGHARSDADYVLARRPDWIVIPKAGEAPIRLPALEDLWSHPGLARHYVWDAELEAYRLREAGSRGR